MLPLCLAQQCIGEALLCPVAAALLNSHRAAPQAWWEEGRLQKLLRSNREASKAKVLAPSSLGEGHLNLRDGTVMEGWNAQ